MKPFSGGFEPLEELLGGFTFTALRKALSGSIIASTSDSKPSSPWILDSRKDFLFFIATPLLILPLALGAKLRFSVEEISAYILALGGVGHHLPGMIRAYGDRNLFRRYRIRFLLAPIFLVCICVLYAFYNLRALELVLLIWGAWHGAMQVFGFMRIYDAKARRFSPLGAWLDLLMCLAWFGTGLWLSPDRLVTILAQFYGSGGILVPPTVLIGIKNIWLAGTGILTLAYLGHMWLQWRNPSAPGAARGQAPNALKLILLAVSAGFWCYCLVGLGNAVLGVALFEIFHDVQYLAIVWVYNRNRVTKQLSVSDFEKFLFQPRLPLLGLYVAMVGAYGFLHLVPGWMGEGRWPQILKGALIASALLHFYFDGFIWKVRDEETRKGLGLDVGNQGNSRTGIISGWVHGLKWLALAVPVMYLGLVQFRGKVAPDPEQYANLAEAVPGSWYAHFMEASILKTQGRWDQAIDQYEKVLERKLKFAEAHKFLADLRYRQGAATQALQHYEAAAKLDPEDEEVLQNLGMLYQDQGRLEEAASQFRQALAIRPEFPEARFNLGYVYLLQKKPVAAAAEFTRSVALQPNNARAYYHLGLAQQLSGNREAALDGYTTALKLDTAYAAARQALAALTEGAKAESASTP